MMWRVPLKNNKIWPAVLLGWVALAFLLFSCSRTIDRPTDTDLEIDAPATPSAVSVSVGDQTVVLSWAQVDDASQYRVYRADTTAAGFRKFDSTAQTTFTDQNVANNVLYFYRVASVSVDGLEGVQSPSVVARPGVFSIAIDSDKPYTNSLTVSLSLTAPTSSGSVLIGNSPDLDQRPWQSFVNGRSWELEPGDGSKTVYAQFRDASGASSIDVVSDEIILDTRAVIDSVTENSAGEALVVGDTVLIMVATGETDGQASVNAGGFNLECFDDGMHGDTLANDGLYYRAWVIPSDADFEAYTVVGRFTDRAGNQAENRASLGILTVRRTPDPVTAFAFTESEAEIDISWTQSPAEDFAFYRVFRATTANVNAESTMVYSSSSKTAASYADTGLESATSYYYSVWVYDKTGLFAASPTVSANTEVNTAPEPVIVSNPVDLDDSRLRITWSKSNEADFASYRIYRSLNSLRSAAVLLAVISNRTETDYIDDNLELATESYYYWVVVYDRGDLSTESEATVWSASNTPPEAVTLSVPQRVDTSMTSLRLTWTPMLDDDFASYRIHRSDSTQLNDADLIAIISNRTDTEYVDGNGKFKEQKYYYWVVVYDQGGLSAPSDMATWEPKPEPEP